MSLAFSTTICTCPSRCLDKYIEILNSKSSHHRKLSSHFVRGSNSDEEAGPLTFSVVAALELGGPAYRDVDVYVIEGWSLVAADHLWKDEDGAIVFVCRGFAQRRSGNQHGEEAEEEALHAESPNMRLGGIQVVPVSIGCP